MESLTKKVLVFQRSGEGLGELVRELAPAVYRFPRRRMGLDDDACGDFYTFFQPRLVRMLGRYQEQGRSFEAYLKTCLGWQLRNFARARRSADRAWESGLRLACNGDPQDEGPAAEVTDLPAEVAGLPEGSAAAGPHLAGGTSCSPGSDQVPPGLAAVLRSPADRRNFLFLVLKCPGFCEGPKAEAAAAAAGVPVERLRLLSRLLAERGSARAERLRVFAERRNKAFCLARLLESELRCEADPDRRQVLLDRLEKAKGRVQTAMERMARVGLAPTNREIAEALALPKGTVDSGLFFLKRKLAALLDPDTQQTA